MGHWLAARLAQVHSAFRGPDGGDVRTGHEDRLAIVFSHHGIDTLANTRHLGPGREPLSTGTDLQALLHRFPDVVLWLNGHTHRLAGGLAGRAARAGGEILVEWPRAFPRHWFPGERRVGGAAPRLRL